MEEKEKRTLQQQLLQQVTTETSVTAVQAYIQKVNTIRGFESQSIQDIMLLLTEEVGELAKSIRKYHTTITTDVNKQSSYDHVESEVADVFYMLNCVCNKLEINMLEALVDKESENIQRTWK